MYVLTVESCTKVDIFESRFLDFISCLVFLSGELEVRRGIHSDAFLVMQKSLKSSNESYVRLILDAEFGLHFRLRVWPNITGTSVAFVTGTWESFGRFLSFVNLMLTL